MVIVKWQFTRDFSLMEKKKVREVESEFGRASLSMMCGEQKDDGDLCVRVGWRQSRFLKTFPRLRAINIFVMKLISLCF